MSNNKEHKANYSLKTVTGFCPMGFKQTSGTINRVKMELIKMIKTPLNEPKNIDFNKAINRAISEL